MRLHGPPLALLIALTPTAGTAQISPPPMMNMMLYEGPRIALQDHAARQERDGRSPTAQMELRNSGDPSRLSGTAASSTTYRPSSSRRRANYAKFIEKTRRVDPAGAQSLAATLATDPITQMAPELAKVGLSTTNVADAYTVYWVEAWQAAHGVTDASSREIAQAVRQQAADALLATPEFTRSSDEQKQEFADSLLVQALLIGAAKEQASGSPATLHQIASAVRKGAKGMGLDLDAMTLTEQGFVPAKRTGAADPAPGARPEALAAAPADAQPGYGFLAAAGGAGLGAAFLLGKAVGRRG